MLVLIWQFWKQLKLFLQNFPVYRQEFLQLYDKQTGYLCGCFDRWMSLPAGSAQEYLSRWTSGVIAGSSAKLSEHAGNLLTFCFSGTARFLTVILIIPFVDAAVLLEKTHPEFAARYKKASEQIAAYLYAREGFHTEAYVSPLTDPEMEDGSISCTALSLLYYCAKIRRVEKYIVRAKEILDMHEAWMTRAPIAPCFRSSLRWWETFWEGDGDGPSICFGHAWTIWRAEADYWYYKLTRNEEYKEKAFNGYMSKL